MTENQFDPTTPADAAGAENPPKEATAPATVPADAGASSSSPDWQELDPPKAFDLVAEVDLVDLEAGKTTGSASGKIEASASWTDPDGATWYRIEVEDSPGGAAREEWIRAASNPNQAAPLPAPAPAPAAAAAVPQGAPSAVDVTGAPLTTDRQAFQSAAAKLRELADLFDEIGRGAAQG